MYVVVGYRKPPWNTRFDLKLYGLYDDAAQAVARCRDLSGMHATHASWWTGNWYTVWVQWLPPGDSSTRIA